ncbi:peptidase C65 Otubain-domain-containing protein [Xylogone sp. PMI_703]|nr:peptidase C65 Otubain-domain-containing protein [Xylogone sp. PMI_703]
MEPGTGVNDLEAQEALARDFRPDLQGPLIGEKRSSLAITEEYAKADPIYVAKTAALPQKYSHYRPVSGDGNCGWRAAGFSYFETLVQYAMREQFDAEIARMTSLTNLLTSVGGFEKWLFEDMVDETISLLRLLRDSYDDPQMALDLLTQRFNNPEISNAIVYHFRLLASSWLKGSASSYEGFIPDGLGVDGYRKDWIEVPNQEIDHLGMTLLIDVLLKPVGFAVEIVYLDRSEGTQVNSHIIQAEDANGLPTNPGAPMIHLLYRPSHYDILYKDIPPPPPPIPQLAVELESKPNVQVLREYHGQKNAIPITNFSSISDLDTLASIPGFSYCPPPSSSSQLSYAQPAYTMDQRYPHSTMSSSASPISPGAGSSPEATTTVQYTPPQPSNILPQQNVNMPGFPIPPQNIPAAFNPPHVPNLPVDRMVGEINLNQSISAGASPGPASSFRPSIYEWEAAANYEEDPAPALMTSTFRNSHYNTAHYNNPNFQPEEWTPDSDEYLVAVNGRRKKSTS